MTSKTITARSRKDDILDAFRETKKERDAMRRQLDKLEKELEKAKAAPSAGATSRSNVQSGAPMPTNSVEAIIHGLSSLRSGFGDSASVLQQKLTAEATRLDRLKTQSEEHTRVLATLHGVETIDEATLSRLVSSWEDKKKTADDEMSGRQASFTEELETLELAWTREQDEQKRLVKERNDNLKKSRTRELEAYEYDKNRKRAMDSDTFEQQLKAIKKELTTIEETSRKQWETQEESLLSREKEFDDLKARTAAFPELLEDAVKKAREEGTGIARRQARIKENLLTKENEGKSRVYELRIGSLEQTLDKQRAQIRDLSGQLDAAMRQAQELAVKAIEGASNATSFQAVKEIALEQAKNPQKGK